MRFLFASLILLLLSAGDLFSQTYSTERSRFPKLGEVRLLDLPDAGLGIHTLEAFNNPIHRLDAIKPPYQPVPGGRQLNKKPAAPLPQVEFGFAAQTPSGTPLDNNIAVGKNGLILSAVNTTIRITDSSGAILFTRTLSSIANALGTLDRTFDPHALYDPETDRYILVFLNGSDHTDTRVIVGFSEGNDPRQNWNFYALPGNTTSNDWWSDYPFIGMSKDELFISVLLWEDGESGWDTDASDENIWQINKLDGYQGEDSLDVRQYHELEFAGRQLWNTRPMGQSDKLYGPDFYFLGNRPKDQQNDTFFLIHISGTLDDPNTALTLTPVRSDIAYGLQPNVTQKGGRRLRTNYCDIQNGYRFEHNLYFCSNTIDPSSGRPGIYVGKVVDLENNPRVEGQLFGIDSLDLNYPSMAYCGGGWPDESAMVMCLHNSQNSYPGTSVFAVGRDFSPSDLLRLKEGEGPMNILFSDSLERWGDYTGIQRDYGMEGRVWLAGSFGRSNQLSQTWIAAVRNTDQQLGVEPGPQNDSRVYPNPGSRFTVEFSLAENARVQVLLTDMQGREVLNRYEYLSAGMQRVELQTAMSEGQYVLIIRGEDQRLILRKQIQVK